LGLSSKAPLVLSRSPTELARLPSGIKLREYVHRSNGAVREASDTANDAVILCTLANTIRSERRPLVGIPVELWLSELIHVVNPSCQPKQRAPAKFIFVVFALVMLALVGFRFSR
jgi:hypothetical protein